MIPIRPRQLEVFVGIVDLGSVRAAAQSLHLTQPAASMALAELERQLDAPLFNREHARLQLNERGRELLPQAREILARFEEVLHGREALGKALNGTLRLGASNTVGNYLVGEWLGDFVKAHPGVAVNLEVGNTFDIVARLREHKLDVACVEGEVMHPDLETLPWREDRLVVCASPEHPLAGRRGLEPPDFAGSRWILREPGSATRALCERALAGLPGIDIVLELGQTEAIKQAVIAKLGLACLPEVALADALATGRLVVLDAAFLDLARRMVLLRGRSAYHGVVVEAFMGVMREGLGM